MRSGTFTNTVIAELTSKINIPIADVTDFLLPVQNREHPFLRELISKVVARQPMMASASGSAQPRNPRLHPMISDNGTFFLIEQLIDKKYGGQIQECLKDLRSQPSSSRQQVQRVLIDGPNIKEEDLIAILRCFDGNCDELEDNTIEGIK